ncbi:MAG: gamma-glutamyl-gamma-aminobutyrate hydrolase family protein [Thermoleophilia bacterium]|nr:gamma-glutamyl-gamma-aminobutyrate hydrolase family protein [Thermoleophilia bacterium]
MLPPVILIACAVLPARWGPWDQPAATLAADYVWQVQAAGGIALVLPPHTGDVGPVLDTANGLILTGGTDVEATRYGRNPHAEAEEPDSARDQFELALVAEAIARDMPFLGICRGMQLLNIAFGGTLTQHLPESPSADTHCRTMGTFAGNDHLVHLTPGSLAARVAGEHAHVVPSHHHQAVDRLGDGIVLTGHADGDDVIEAIEMPACAFALGVQWHPEVDPTSRVVAALVDAAREARSITPSVPRRVTPL